METYTNDVQLPIKEGIDPVIAFCLISKEASFVKALIVLGIVPERELEFMETTINDVKLPIKEGIDPVIAFCPISKEASFVKALIVLGIVPDREF